MIQECRERKGKFWWTSVAGRQNSMRRNLGYMRSSKCTNEKEHEDVAREAIGEDWRNIRKQCKNKSFL